MHFSVRDDRGREIGSGDDLHALKKAHRARVESSAARQAESFGDRDLDGFPDFEIPRTKRNRQGGLNVVVYPALKLREDSGGVSVDLTAMPTALDQRREHVRAVTHLVTETLGSNSAQVLGSLPNPTKLAISQSSYGSAKALLSDAALAASAELISRTENGGLVWTKAEFDALVEAVRAEHAGLSRTLVLAAVDALALHAKLQRAVSKVSSLSVLQQLTQIREHADSLTSGRFISRTPAHIVPEIPRYLKADIHRIEKMQDNPARDAQLAWQIEDLAGMFEKAKSKISAETLESEEAREIPWMLEELRVSFFAQQLGTRYTVSEKRVRRAIADLR